MAVVAGGFVYKNASILVDTVEMANQFQRAILVPEQETKQYPTLVPIGTVVDEDEPTWTFQVRGLQINKANGFAEALRDAGTGAEIDIVLQPELGSAQKKATFIIKAKMPPFGGDRGEFAEIDMSFGVVGQPTWSETA